MARLRSSFRRKDPNLALHVLNDTLVDIWLQNELKLNYRTVGSLFVREEWSSVSTANDIKQEAMKLFSLHGYDGASMGAIAEQVGLRKASLYSHFKSKNELFLSIVDELVEKNRFQLEQVVQDVASGSTENRLYAIFQHLSYYPLEQGKSVEFDFFRRVLFFPPVDLKLLLIEKIRAYEQQLHFVLVEMLEVGIAEKQLAPLDVDDMLSAFICTADGVMMQIHYESLEQFEKMAKSAWLIFWNGIRRC